MNEFLYSLVILTICVWTNVCASKYSEEVNKHWHDDEVNPFRSYKVNQVWGKAKKRLSGPLLADFYSDLHLQDKHEMHLKRILLDNQDEDGFKEADVRLRFRTLVKKYGLLKQFEHLGSDISNDIPTDDDGGFDRLMEFGDERLQKIWKKALMSGFNDDELEKLKTEFWHQQMKVEEYSLFRDELSDLDDISANTLNGESKTDDSIPIPMQQNQKDLKAQHRKIKEGYLRLEGMSINKDVEFSDPRVYQLWAVARNANMSAEELHSFKKELKHFEHRISKHEYMKDQLLVSLRQLGPEVKVADYPEKHRRLEETADNYAKKVKKLHGDLKKQVDKAIARHSEL